MNKSSIVLTLALSLSSYICFSQTQSSTTSTASATIVQALTLTEESQLNFGTISSTSSGQVVISPVDSNRTITGGVLGLTGGATSSRASFKATGTNNCSYSVTIPQEITISNTDGATMVIDDLVIHFDNTGMSNNIGIFNSEGKDTVSIGAKLNVQDAQQSGFYVGEYNVSIDYN